MTARPPRVAAFGYFGMGNLGNEGSLAAFADRVRCTSSQVRLTCFGADPVRVQEEHGIPAQRLMSFRPDQARGGWRIRVHKAVSRLWDVPRMFRMMGDVDVLVVPGTGVLEKKPDVRPWGMPYWLFVATGMCRLRGGKVALICVGADAPPHPLTRGLYRWTVRLSDHVSYRDEASRRAVQAMGVGGRIGEAHPDLAFALPLPARRPPRPGHVVIGVMTYLGDPDDPGHGPGTLRTYVDHMTQVVTRLTDDGRTVTLAIGDVGDRGLALEIESRVVALRPDLTSDRLSVSKAEDLEALMLEMTDAEVVVATRFHNVICALKLDKPVVSLGYADKNEHLMAEFGLGEFCQPVASFDVELLLRQIDEVQARLPSLRPFMAQARERFETEVHRHLEQVCAEVIGTDDRETNNPQVEGTP